MEAHLANLGETRYLQQQVRYALAVALLLAAPAAAAAQTEFHIQYGSLDNPFSGQVGHTEQTVILTFQHALSWSLGDSFFFVDFIDDVAVDGFNDRDFYGEWYPTLSFGKLTNRTVGVGPLRDIAIIGGINFGGDADVLKYLPGVRASWDVPGFYFLNTDVTAFIDANTGLEKGGSAPKTSNSWMFDVSWGSAIDVSSQTFVFTGHVEYIGGRIDELGHDVKGWVLAQPQFMWDVGRAVANEARNQIFLGIEYQYWLNKLETDVDEHAVQLLIVWRL